MKAGLVLLAVFVIAASALVGVESARVNRVRHAFRNARATTLAGAGSFYGDSCSYGLPTPKRFLAKATIAGVQTEAHVTAVHTILQKPVGPLVKAALANREWAQHAANPVTTGDVTVQNARTTLWAELHSCITDLLATTNTALQNGQVNELTTRRWAVWGDNKGNEAAVLASSYTQRMWQFPAGSSAKSAGNKAVACGGTTGVACITTLCTPVLKKNKTPCVATGNQVLIEWVPVGGNQAVRTFFGTHVTPGWNAPSTEEVANVATLSVDTEANVGNALGVEANFVKWAGSKCTYTISTAGSQFLLTSQVNGCGIYIAKDATANTVMMIHANANSIGAALSKANALAKDTCAAQIVAMHNAAHGTNFVKFQKLTSKEYVSATSVITSIFAVRTPNTNNWQFSAQKIEAPSNNLVHPQFVQWKVRQRRAHVHFLTSVSCFVACSNRLATGPLALSLFSCRFHAEARQGQKESPGEPLEMDMNINDKGSARFVPLSPSLSSAPTSPSLVVSSPAIYAPPVLDPVEAERKRRAKLLKLIGLLTLTVACGVGNNVSFARMAQTMNGFAYAPFLLYFPPLFYVTAYLVLMLVFARTREAQQPHLWKWYLVLGLFVGIPQIFSQFADPFVDGSLQSILGILTLPGTYVGVRLFLPEIPSYMQLIGCIVATLGVLIAVVPQAVTSGFTGDTTGLGILAFSIGVLGGSAVDVLQQKLFRSYNVSIWVQLFWPNFISEILFVPSMFFTLLPSMGGDNIPWVWDTQRQAFQCFAGVEPLPDGCSADALWWVIAFMVFYVGYFWLQAVLIRNHSAVFQAVVLSLVTPLSSLAFRLDIFGGTPLTWEIYVSLIVVVLGVVLYRTPRTAMPVWCRPPSEHGKDGGLLAEQMRQPLVGGANGTSDGATAGGGEVMPSPIFASVTERTGHLTGVARDPNSTDPLYPHAAAPAAGNGSVFRPSSRSTHAPVTIAYDDDTNNS